MDSLAVSARRACIWLALASNLALSSYFAIGKIAGRDGWALVKNLQSDFDDLVVIKRQCRE